MVSTCNNCKYYKMEYAPYIHQRVMVCTLKGNKQCKRFGIQKKGTYYEAKDNAKQALPDMVQHEGKVSAPKS